MEADPNPLDWLNGTILIDSARLIDQVRAMGLDFSRTSLQRDLARVEADQRKLRGECVQPYPVEL